MSAGLLLLAALAGAGELDDARQHLAAGEVQAAGRLLAPRVERDAEAAALYAELLASQQLSEAALLSWAHALQLDPAAVRDHTGPVVDLAIQTGDTAALGQAALGADLDTLPASPARGALALWAARAAIRSGDFEAALPLTDLVTPSDPAFVESRVLRGVALSNLERYGEALAALLIADAAVPADNAALRDLVKINLARAYYASENPLRAIEHYVQVSRGGEQWIHAHWERAWAHFSVDDMPGALSLLRAFETPYLSDRYLAEGDMLRIYSMFLMCKFPSAKSELDQFQARYEPLSGELDQALTSASEQSAWEDLRRWQREGSTTLPAVVFQAYEGDDRAALAVQTAEVIEREQALLAERDASWTGPATSLLDARAEALRSSEGGRVLGRARQMSSELREWLDSADLTRLDILDYERKLLQQAANTGELELGDRLGEIRRLRQRRGTRVWPVSEEVWADEVGYESVRTRSDCREDIL